MRQMKRLFQLAFAALIVILVGCTSSVKDTPEISVSPTNEFTGKNSFGDGYIAHIPINDVKDASQEEIVRILVTQWLDHYKADNTATDATVKDYALDSVYIIERKNDNDPTITASVKFSIIPAQIPNEWASFPGDISPDDPWWHLVILFGVHGGHQGSQYYWLSILPVG